MAGSSPLRIALLLYPGAMPAGLFAFADLAHAANRRTGRTLFDTRFAGLAQGHVECAHGQRLQAGAALGEEDFDVVLVPGLWAETAQSVEQACITHAALVAMLGRLGRHTMLWSYCTGVGLLAASGRLDGQPATATWWLAESLRRRHRKVEWQFERTSVMNARTATASGVNGYLPLAQALIEQHTSASVYRDLSRLMVLPRPERTHPAFLFMSLIEQSDATLRALHSLVERTPASEATVQRLAQGLGVSERTLARRVAGTTGMAVGNYVRRIKLNQVSERLILTAAPASTISAELGFSSDASMRRMFKALTALSPGEYRRRFGRG